MIKDSMIPSVLRQQMMVHGGSLGIVTVQPFPCVEVSRLDAQPRALGLPRLLDAQTDDLYQFHAMRGGCTSGSGERQQGHSERDRRQSSEAGNDML